MEKRGAVCATIEEHGHCNDFDCLVEVLKELNGDQVQTQYKTKKCTEKKNCTAYQTG